MVNVRLDYLRCLRTFRAIMLLRRCKKSTCVFKFMLYVVVSDPDLVYDKCVERDEGFETALDKFPNGYKPGIVQPEMSGTYHQ